MRVGSVPTTGVTRVCVRGCRRPGGSAFFAARSRDRSGHTDEHLPEPGPQVTSINSPFTPTHREWSKVLYA